MQSNASSCFVQQSRMEERLDDAIYVLRNHAEGQFPRDFHAQMGGAVGVPGYSAGAVPSSLPGNATSSVESAVSRHFWVWLVSMSDQVLISLPFVSLFVCAFCVLCRSLHLFVCVCVSLSQRLSLFELDAFCVHLVFGGMISATSFPFSR